MTVTRRKLSGLNVDANPRDVPEGSLSIATNVVCRREGVIEPRPGLQQSTQISSLADVQRIVPYDGALTAIDDTETVKVSADTNITNQDYSAGQLAGYDGFCSTTEARGNLYMATQDGVQKVLSSTATGAFMAGEHQFAEVVIAATDNSANSDENWLAGGDGCAYRIVLRTEDGNGVITRSTPTTPYFVTNTSGAGRRILLIIYINDEGYFNNTWIEVYRTTSNAVGVPAEDYFLALEHPVTAAIEAAGSVNLYDTKPDSELGQALYSNTSQEGRFYSPPRRGKALATFAGSVFNGNITSPQHMFVNFAITAPNNSSVTTNMDVTSGSPNATLNSQTPNYNGTTFRVGMFVYHATYFPNGALVTAVAGSAITFDTNASATGAGVTIESYDTIAITDGTTTEVYLAYYIVYNVMTNVASGYTPITTGPSALVTARWTAGYNSSLGLEDYSFYLEEIPGTSATLQIKATNAQARYNTELSEYGTGYADFEKDVEPALVEWSLLDQPETFVRGIEQVYVGDLGKPVWSMLESGRRLYITKGDEGIYVLDGNTQRAGFRLEKLTQQYRPMSPRHICQGIGGLYVWTTEGVIEIGLGGSIRPLSQQRINKKLALFHADETSLLGCMFYADNEVHLLARQTLYDITQAAYLVFNTQTQQWTEWTVPEDYVTGCAPGASLYGELSRFAIATNNSGDIRLWQAPRIIQVSSVEKPPEWYHADLWSGTTSVTATPASAGTSLYTITASFSAFTTIPTAGDMLISDSQQWKGVVTAVTNNGGGSYTLTFYATDTVAASSTTVQVLYAFEVALRLRELSSNNPLAWRHWREVTWEMLGPMSLYKATLDMQSSGSGADGFEETVVQTAKNYPSYTDPADLVPYQSGWFPRYLLRARHARSHAIEPGIRIAEGGAIWALAAVSAEEARGSTRRHRN